MYGKPIHGSWRSATTQPKAKVHAAKAKGSPEDEDLG